MSTLLTMFLRVAKIIHSESFKDINCSFTMQIAEVWFRRVQLRVFLGSYSYCYDSLSSLIKINLFLPWFYLLTCIL